MANVLPDTQIYQAAYSAGFRGQDAITATAIALAESGGDTADRTGDNGTSWGLWQIHWTVHPDANKMQLNDPAYNASYAYTLYKNRGRGFQDWSTYNHGTYKQYLGRATIAAQHAGASGIGAAPPSGPATDPTVSGQPTPTGSGGNPLAGFTGGILPRIAGGLAGAFLLMIFLARATGFKPPIPIPV